MRFGMSGAFLPSNMDDFTEEIAIKVKKLGFSGIFTRFGANNPFETTKQQCRRVRSILENHSLRMYQATGYWQPLMQPDETIRKKAARTLQEALRVAGELGARGIDTGPGSMSPTGPWNPHPDNWNPKLLEQLIKSLKECVKAAEDNQVYLSLEGHQLVCLESAEVTKMVLDEVKSEWVRSDLDPANWITLKTIYRTGEAIDHMFDVLGKHIVSGHVKDITIENRHTLYMPTCSAGKGLLDFAAYIRRMEALSPEYPLIVEGSSESELPEVSAFLHKTAEGLGIKVLSE